MVKLNLPLTEPSLEPHQPGSKIDPDCDNTQTVFNNTQCIKSFRFCSERNPCPAGISCIDRICQCEPNQGQYITLTPQPLRLYTLGCNFDRPREVNGCRTYEYGVQGKCLLNYCDKNIPCYAGTCDPTLQICVNINATRVSLPPNPNPVISLEKYPIGGEKIEEGFPPLLIIIIAALSVAGLALIGCIIRMVLLWTKTSIRWASRGGRRRNVASENGDDDDDIEKHNYDNDDSGSSSGLTRKPTKFTGSHYMPQPELRLSTFNSNDASPMTSSFLLSHSRPSTSLSQTPRRLQTRGSSSALSGGSMTPSSIEMETRSVKSMAGTAVTNGSQSSLDLYLDYTANNGRGTPIHQTFIQSPLSKLSSLDQRANTHSGELKGSLNAQEKGLATGSILSRTTMKSEPLTLFSGVGPSKTGGTANLPDISLSASSPEFKSMPLPVIVKTVPSPSKPVIVSAEIQSPQSC